MKDQSGFTLIELAVTIAIITAISAMAVLSGAGLVTSARVSKSTSLLLDHLSFSRERAMARSERWMLTFPSPLSGSDTVSFYELAWCDLAARACEPGNAADWQAARESAVAADTGIGFQVLQPAGGSAQPVQITFDRTGRNITPDDVDVKICVTVVSASGTVSCRTGGTATSIRIRKASGLVQSLP